MTMRITAFRMSRLLALLLLLALAGCGGQTAGDMAKPASEPAAEQQVQQAPRSDSPPPPATPAPTMQHPEVADSADEAAGSADDMLALDEGAAEGDMEEMAAEEAPMEMESGAAPPPEAAPMPNDGASVVERQPVEVNPFVLTVEDHLSTFALDVDTASYTAARNYLTNGSRPYPEEVRVEEFVNYFDYGYPEPQGQALGIVLEAAPSPWTNDETAASTHMVRVGIQGKHIDASQRKDAVLTFVIDVSGSMQEPNRLPLVKEALRLLVEELRPTDQVAIVVYSDNTRVLLEHTGAEDRETIMQAINALHSEGSTNVEDGLRLAYEIAGQSYENGAINRVILCSDGVANVGATGPDAIRQVIRDYTAQGVLLTTVGFGMGDYNDYLMEQLADDGNGNYAYVDTLDAANRVFVENLTGMLQVIANDAKVQVEFDPAVVQSYRLLGYENRDVADEDFRNDTVDAGEVGAGHNVTALYELRLTEQQEGTALTVMLRYEDPETGEVSEVAETLATEDVAATFDETSPEFQLAVAVAGFAEELRESGYVPGRSMEDVLELAERVAAQLANDGDVQEFAELVRTANELL